MVGTNPHFYEVTASSYQREWGIEASRHLRLYWNARHEGLARNGWGNALIFYWQKLRRVGGLILMAVHDRSGLIRPHIVGGVLHHVRTMLCRKTYGDRSAP